MAERALFAVSDIRLHLKKEESNTLSDYHVLQSVPRRMRFLRIKAGLPQKEAAEKFGISRHMLHDYEYGKVTEFDLNVISQMSKCYGVPEDDLLDGYNQFLRDGQGAQIKAWRKRLNLSMKAMARFMGTSKSTILDWEHERKTMKKKTWEKVVAVIK